MKAMPFQARMMLPHHPHKEKDTTQTHHERDKSRHKGEHNQRVCVLPKFVVPQLP
jgi:hypothetical protein